MEYYYLLNRASHIWINKTRSKIFKSKMPKGVLIWSNYGYKDLPYAAYDLKSHGLKAKEISKDDAFVIIFENEKI